MANGKAALAALVLVAALCLSAQTSTAQPTAPTSGVPTGGAPTGAAPTGAAPTGATPTGSAPTTPTKPPPPASAPTPTAPTPTASTPTTRSPPPKVPPPPTATPTTTPAPPPATSCTSGSYLFQGKCNRCLSKASPFVTKRGGYTCYPPATLSSKSVACTPATLPILIRGVANPSKTKTCIGKKDSKITTIYLPISSSKYSYLNSKAYKKVSLRLNNSIPAITASNKQVISKLVSVKGKTRLQVQFEDTFGTFHKRSSGDKVKLTGVLERGGTLLPVCFVAYTKIC